MKTILIALAIVVAGWFAFDSYATKARATYLSQCDAGMTSNRFVANSIKFTEGAAGKEFIRRISHAGCECMTGLFIDRNGRARTALYQAGLLGTTDIKLPGQEDLDSCGRLIGNDVELLKRLAAGLEDKK